MMQKRRVKPLIRATIRKKINQIDLIKTTQLKKLQEVTVRLRK